MLPARSGWLVKPVGRHERPGLRLPQTQALPLYPGYVGGLR